MVFDMKVNSIGNYDFILGLPWLNAHRAVIHCGEEGRGVEIGSLVVLCDEHDISSSDSVCTAGFSGSVTAQEIEDVKKYIPSKFHQFADVFLPQNTALPPHRKHDVEINLKDGCEPPTSRAYNLFASDESELKAWIDDQLAKGFIRLLSSPASAPGFLVKSPGRKNCPCIYYQGLNKVTVKDSYPIPLVKSLLSRIRGCKRYYKIDLKAVFDLLRIKAGHEWKTAFRGLVGCTSL